MLVIFRRRLLGNTSVRGIVSQMESQASVYTNGRIKRTAKREGPWPAEVEKVIRWGCTASLPTRVGTVINSASAIKSVNDKLSFRRMLHRHAAQSGSRELCPRTWSLDEEIPDIPLVVRPPNHSQGRHLYVCRTRADFIRAAERCPNGYASELIDKASEWRVFVAQGRAVWVARKTPGDPNQIAWNVARGGRFDNVLWGEWPLRIVRTAIEACNVTELHFGGVDVIVDRAGRPYVIEINSAPSQTSPYRQRCCARVFDFMHEYHSNRIPLDENPGGWRKFIHPCLS